jgi:hypothetical protein
MIEFEPGYHWKWVGPFLGSQIIYDHIFSQDAPRQTTIRFTVDTTGWSAALLGRFFGRVYQGNLNRAIPSLIKEIEASAAVESWGRCCTE